MNENPHIDDMPAPLRMQLRGLRRDAEPARDLWPDIGARIAIAPREDAVRPVTRPARLRMMPGLAAAAVLALALGIGWQLRPDGAAPQPAPMPSTGMPAGAPLMAMADAMTREYQGALREITAFAPAAGEQATLSQLDASATAVRDALAMAPDSVFLLHKLQRIYSQRLSLTQRLAGA